MRLIQTAALAAFSLPLLSASVAMAQQGNTWDKTYPLNGRPHLQVEVEDAALEVSSCGSCNAIHIHVDGRGDDLSHYSVRELQGGNTVHFTLHEKPGGGWFHWNMHKGPLVTVELPSAADVTTRSADGSMSMRDISGAVDVSSSDGSLSASHVSGALRFHTSDGSMSIQDAEGTLEARTSDGSMSIRGRFSQIDAHTSDGSGNLTLEEGSKLTGASSIGSQDGSFHVLVPRSLAVELDISSADGSVSCNLPLQTETSETGEHHHIHGRLNGGGPSLTIHTSDGSISVSPL